MEGIIVVNEFLKSRKFDEIAQMLMDAFEKLKVKVRLVTNAFLMREIGLSRVTDKFAVFYDKDILLAKRLENIGYKVFNSSRAIEICDDKGYTAVMLEGKDIAMPNTIVAPFTYDNIGYTNTDFLVEVADKLHFPLVVKESKGSFGSGVYLVNNSEELAKAVAKIAPRGMIFQQFIASSRSKDMRLQVVGGEVVASVMRISSDDFRANVTNGGKMVKYEASAEARQMAVRACQSLGVDFAGVDILFGDSGEPIFCEINSNAHFKNIYDCSGINVANYLAEYVIAKTNLL